MKTVTIDANSVLIITSATEALANRIRLAITSHLNSQDLLESAKAAIEREIAESGATHFSYAITRQCGAETATVILYGQSTCTPAQVFPLVRLRIVLPSQDD